MARRLPALAMATLVTACADRPPDVVLVVLDTLRADRLELYGSERATAPYLTRVARRGAVFRNAFSSSSWTPPATASIATGLYPRRHGVVHGFTTNQRIEELVARGRQVELDLTSLPACTPTLAERFRAAGWSTHGVATNVHVRPELGFGRGFDAFVHEHLADAERVAEIVRSFDRPGDRPSFLYLHLNDVHGPYEAREPWYGRYRAEDGLAPGDPLETDAAGRTLPDLLRRYDSEIAYTDAVLAGLHDDLGWDENTLLAFTSDHGEAFGEHGEFGHGPTLHHVVNRVLLAFSGPGVPAVELDVNASLVDLCPTLLELAHAPAPAGVDGLSLVPSIRAAAAREPCPAAPAERVVFAHRRTRELPPRFLWSAVRGPWKLLHDESSGETRLFHLGRDTAELVDLAAGQPERVAELRASRAAYERAVAPEPGSEVAVELGPELTEHLRAIGYASE